MDAALLGLIILIALSSYFLPTIIARTRSARRPATIFAVNLLLGWTVVGWVTALIWAMSQHPQPGEPVKSPLVEADGWFLDLSKVSERDAVDQVDRWTLGLENLLEPRRNR